MTTRVAFDPQFLHAVQIRGLTITALAQRAGLSPATVSAAVHGKRVKRALRRGARANRRGLSGHHGAR